MNKGDIIAEVASIISRTNDSVRTAGHLYAAQAIDELQYVTGIRNSLDQGSKSLSALLVKVRTEPLDEHRTA